MSGRATIVFVCTGNTCRSPMAAALFNAMLAEKGLADRWHALSAGTAALADMPANEKAIASLAAEGVDLRSHRATPLGGMNLADAALILTMTRHHKDEVVARHPEVADRVFTLGEYAGDPFGSDWEVEDPIGGDQQVYDRCRNDLRSVLERVIDRLKAALSKDEGSV